MWQVDITFSSPVSNFYITLIWQFVCTVILFTCRAVKSCFTVWVQQCSLHGWDRSYKAVSRDPTSARKTFSMEQGGPSQIVHVCERTWSVHCSFCGTYFFWYRPQCSWSERHYITVLAAFMYAFPLFGMLFYLYIPEPVLWDHFHSPQLDWATIHTMLSLSSCHSLWCNRDCPVRHASQKRHNLTCSQWKTQTTFKRIKTGCQEKACHLHNVHNKVSAVLKISKVCCKY